MKPAVQMLLDYRESKGIKQVHVAEKSGISVGKLSAIECGRRRLTADDFLTIITLGFGLSPSVFFDHELPKNESKSL